MNNTLTSLLRSAVVATIIISLSGCDGDELQLIDGERADFILKNTAGKEVVLDRTWYRDCIAEPHMGVWTASQRTLSTNELSITEIFYASDNCKSSPVMIEQSVINLTNTHKMVDISWIEMDGSTPAANPTGLEGVTQANALTYTINKATRTALTQDQVNLLNNSAFGFGITTWEVGVTMDLKPIYESLGVPASSNLILHDKGGSGCVYDGHDLDPTKMGNIPHCGPLHSL